MNNTIVRTLRDLRRRLLCGLTAGLVVMASGVPGGGQSPVSAQSVPSGEQAPSETDAFTTTVAYVVQFYPLWFTYFQSQFANANRLVGPDRVTALYQIVVAINNDTIYASTFLDLTAQPVILSIPATSNVYSVLTLDPYGNIFASGIPSQPPGTSLPAATYALTGPGFSGTLPPGVIPIAMPLDFTELIFRADKFSSTGEDQTATAEEFRAGLFTQPLCTYLGQACPPDTPPGGSALILSEIAFALPFKTTADRLIARDPIRFLGQLQTAVAAPRTPALTPSAQALSDEFDRLFGDGHVGARGGYGSAKVSALAAGAQAAHQLILDRYLSHLGPTNWIHFTNIGAWGNEVIERASITEFIQYGNGISTAAYYHTFRDERGRPLDGSHGHVLTFRPSTESTFCAGGPLPQASRFWSLTAYTPESIELIANPADKYLVASYTPGLQPNADGSLSVHIARELPPGVPMANWLPVSHRPFNVMLRVYGPEGCAADNTYVPPAIVRIR